MQILQNHLEQVSGLAFLQPYAGATVGGLCALGAGALAFGDLDTAEDARWPAVGATAACAAGGFASYLAPVDHQAPIVTASLTTGLALDMILLTHFSDYATPAIRVTMFGFSGGMAALGILGLVDSALRPPLSSVRLRAHAQALAARGKSLTRAELARMEADLELFSNRPIPRWAYGAALFTGGLVAFTPVFFDSSSEDDKDIALATGLAVSGIGIFSVTGALLSRDFGYPSYVKALKAVDLTPIGPHGSTGLWATGAF
jgi:hypothetical protein